jgi:hypothetical protein
VHSFPVQGESAIQIGTPRALRTIGVVAAFFYLFSGFIEKDWSMWAVLLIAVVFLGLGFSKHAWS